LNYQFDVVLVGSGPAGVHAAYPLIKAGLRVAIIDGGLIEQKQEAKPKSRVTNKKNTSHAYDLIKMVNSIRQIKSISQILHPGDCYLPNQQP